ncbi:hypothetical protein BDR22DRAFT_918977 [Usnea florida]
MAQPLAVAESPSLSASDALHPAMEQQTDGYDPHTSSNSPGSNPVIMHNIEHGSTLSSSTSSPSSTTMQINFEDDNASLFQFASQHSAMEQQHEGREPDYFLHVEDESTQSYFPPFFPVESTHPGTYLQQEYTPSHSSSGEFSPTIMLTVRFPPTSNTFAQEVESNHHFSFSLSDPSQSSIMLRRNAHAVTGRSSTSQEGPQNMNPERVKQLISSLGFDDDRSEMLFKLVIATARFDSTESLLATQIPEAEALRGALDSLMFAPNSANTDEYPTAAPAKEGFLPGNSNDNPNGDLVPDADAAKEIELKSHEPPPNSPPLLWSSAAIEQSLDPDAKVPKQYTVAEFINTIVKKRIQVESVTDEDWWIEEVRVAIINRLKCDASEQNLTPEDDPTPEESLKLKDDPTHGEALKPEDGPTPEEALKLKDDPTHGEALKPEGGPTPEESLKLKDDPTHGEALKPEGGPTHEKHVSREKDAKKVGKARKAATKQVKGRADTSKADMQRWKEQGPAGWLKRDDGTEMNAEEIDEECARLDAMIRKSRNEEEEKAMSFMFHNIDLKDKGFWNFVRSSKDKEQTQDPNSNQGQKEKAAVSAHHDDGQSSQKKKGSRKNKNKNRKAKKNAAKGADSEVLPEESCDTETFPMFLDLPTEARNSVLGFLLVVRQDLVPFHYVKGKIVKNIGLREKPEMNILLALCSAKDRKIKKCQDDAKNILYRRNTFLIRKPNELIMFLGTIGGDNLARMELGKNLMPAETFFDQKRRFRFELDWLARWGKDLLSAMQGRNIFRQDFAAENAEDDLTCEPTDVEKALKTMVEVMKDKGMMYEVAKDNGTGSGDIPMRLQNLDFGETFTLEETVESMSEKRKRKGREAGREVEDRSQTSAYGKLFLEMTTARSGDDEEDVLSEDSGFYSPSVYSE